MEIFFLIDMIFNFITTYESPTSPEPVSEIGKIFTNYMSNGFYFDLIPLLPLQLMSFDTFKEDLFWVLKTIRFLKGLKSIDVPKFMHNIRNN